MGVTVAVCTYGGPEWIRLAQRAVRSAHAQAPTIHVHGDTLADARNRALQQVDTDWIVYLDADDELTPGYIDEMMTGTADLRAPSVEQVRRYRVRRFMPQVWGHEHECTGECLPHGNWLVIGSMARADLLREVGGWWTEPIYEDWSLWLRCWAAGATVEALPDAVYRAHYRPDSRNRAPSAAVKDEWHRRIYRSCFPQEAA